MAKEKAKPCCPCPTEVARRAIQSAKTCGERRAAAAQFLEAMSIEIDAEKPGPARDKMEKRLFSEATRYDTKADVVCQFPGKSPAAIEAIFRARLNLSRSVRNAAQMRKVLSAKRDEAAAAYAAAQQLAMYRRRRMRAR